MTNVERWALTLLSLLIAASAKAENLDPHELLARMNEAVRMLDYEGRFVVQSGNKLDALHIVHRSDGGNERERVISLTGEPREIVRSDQAVACLVSGGKKPINVTRRAHGRSFSPLKVVNSGELEQFYRFEVLEPDRVAGREVYQVLVQPRDALRFGYRVFLDRASALPLRTIMLDEQQKTVSQMMFTELKVGESIAPIDNVLPVAKVANNDDYDWSPFDRLAPAAWAFKDIPPGFRLNVHRRRAMLEQNTEMEHFIFSDGLATVSVYVQPAPSSGNKLSGASRWGAANAVARSLDRHEVIVVGEVPVKTLDWFANAIQTSQ